MKLNCRKRKDEKHRASVHTVIPYRRRSSDPCLLLYKPVPSVLVGEGLTPYGTRTLYHRRSVASLASTRRFVFGTLSSVVLLHVFWLDQVLGKSSDNHPLPRYVIMSLRPVPCVLGRGSTFSGRPIARFDRMKILNNNTPSCVSIDACSRAIQNCQEGKLWARPVWAFHRSSLARVAEQQRLESPTPWAVHHQSQGDRTVRQEGKQPTTLCLSNVLLGFRRFISMDCTFFDGLFSRFLP